MVFCVLPPQRIVSEVGEGGTFAWWSLMQTLSPGAVTAAMTSVLEGLVGRALFVVVVFSANTSCY